MKKFLIALSLILPLAAFADDLGLNAPQWKDFAPKTFVDVQEPKGLGKFNVTAKYWYERRIAFEEGIAECQTIEAYDERFTCYESLKVKQFKENTDYNGAPLPKGTRTEIREIMQKAYFVIPDEGAIHQGKKRIEMILNRLRNGKFAITADYCEALSLATIAYIILREADK